jgi:hypothetical protein
MALAAGSMQRNVIQVTIMSESQSPPTPPAPDTPPVPPAPPARVFHCGGPLIPGLLIAGLGLFFLAHTMGWMPGSVWQYLTLWPWAFLVFIGVRKMSDGGTHNIVIGLIIALLGGELILQTFGHGYWGEIWRFWPVLLIVGGLLMLLESHAPRPPSDGSGPGADPNCCGYDRRYWRNQRRAFRDQMRAQRWNLRNQFQSQIHSQIQSSWSQWNPTPPAPAPVAGAASNPQAAAASAPPPSTAAGAATPDGWLRMETFFSENKRRIVTPGFQGAHIVAIFGSCKLDLRTAPQPPGARLAIGANAVFGEVQIYVPTTWKVTVHGSGIFGNFQDDTLPPVQPPSDSEVRLDIYGTAAFGQVSVRS